MAFTMMATAGAAYTDQADIEATEAVEMLNAIGVMTGDPDGSFRPNDTITRAEACRMIYSIRTNSDNADAYADMQTTFKDVPADAWYAGYVKHCQAANIVSGTSATTFEPNRDVTTVELALMCLRVMGYDPAKADIGGSTWSTKTIGLATEAGLLKDVNTSATAACPRQWAAQLMYNMVQASTVQWSTDTNSYTKYFDDGKKRPSVGREYLDLWTDVGTLTLVDGKDLSINVSTSDAQDSDNTEVGVHSFTAVAQDYTSLLGQKVKVMYSDGKTNAVLGVYAIPENSILTVYKNQIETENAKIKVDGTLYTLESKGVITIVDGVASEKNWNAVDFKDSQSADVVTLIDSDNNNKIDTAVIKTVKVAKVSFVSSTQIIADVLGDNVGGMTYKTAEENIAADVEKDDFVIITKNLYNENLDIVVAEKATGTVNATKGASSAYTDYQIGEDWYKAYTDRSEINASVKAGNDAEYVVVNNILFYAKKVTGEATLSDVLFVALVGQDGLSSDKAVVMMPDGTKSTVTLKDKYYNADNSADGTKEAQIVAGQFYEFNKSGDEYELFPVREYDANKTAAADAVANKDHKDYYGDYTYEGTTGHTLNATATTSDIITGTEAPEFVAGVAEIADSADIILYAPLDAANSGSYESNPLDIKGYEIMHITGKQLKSNGGKLNVSNLGTTVLGAFSSDVNGLKRASVVAVCYTGADWAGDTTGLVSNANYGFIVSDAVNKDGGIEFKMFTGDSSADAVTVWADKSNATQFIKGTVVGYSTIKTVDDKNVITDVEVVNATAGTISDVKDDNSVIVVNGAELEMKDFNTVIYTNSYNDTITKIVDGKASEAKDGRTNILYIKDSVAIIDANEIVGQVYAAPHGNTVTVPSTIAPADLSSIEWTNAATGETWAAGERANIYDNALMNLRVTARNACELTVTVNGVDVVNYTLAAGETREFESIKIVGAVNVSTGATPAVGGTYSSAADLQKALDNGPVVATGAIPTGTYTTTNPLTLKNATITSDVITSGDVTLDGTTLFGSNGSLEVLGTLNITKETTDSTPVATTINNMSKLVAANKIVDNRATTTAADVDTMLTKSSDITVQDVSGTVTATMAKKTLNVTKDVNLGTAASDADTTVNVGGTATLGASSTLNGDWTVGSLKGAATLLTVNGALNVNTSVETSAANTVYALTMGADASVTLPDSVTAITTLTTNAGSTGTTKLVAAGATVGTYATLTDKTDLTIAIMSGTAATGGADAKITFKGAQTALALAQGTFQFDAAPAAAMTSFASNSKIIINYQMDDKSKLAAPTAAGTTLKFLVAPTQIETSDNTAGGFYATGALTTVITDAGKIQTNVEYVATSSCGTSAGSIGWVGAMKA
ncbi:S-layer homology domain-containing protein [Intestinibacillus sp. Marseille-P6563]|uniref:S-layer homology domain-containing protein n=1 Tax=Intestinibacillus sp. Marseille-P6563 TaxID=2364792 RepID=UPI000F0457D3|nr:S-layer homology domain-containing protein [Intestinibacillus sp. Marseille-P6563]